MVKQHPPKLPWKIIAGLFIFSLVSLAVSRPHYKGKGEFHNSLLSISELECGEYSITIGVYGGKASSFEVSDRDTQNQILGKLFMATYKGIDYFPGPITAEDHVYWITSFSGEPFIATTFEVGGPGLRSYLLGENNRHLYLTNTDELYTLLTQIEAQNINR